MAGRTITRRSAYQIDSAAQTAGVRPPSGNGEIACPFSTELSFPGRGKPTALSYSLLHDHSLRSARPYTNENSTSWHQTWPALINKDSEEVFVIRSYAFRRMTPVYSVTNESFPHCAVFYHQPTK